MKKESVRGLFNSQEGKLNLSLLFSIVLIFVKNFNDKITRSSTIYINDRYIFKGNLLLPCSKGVD